MDLCTDDRVPFFIINGYFIDLCQFPFVFIVSNGDGGFIANLHLFIVIGRYFDFYTNLLGTGDGEHGHSLGGCVGLQRIYGCDYTVHVGLHAFPALFHKLGGGQRREFGKVVADIQVSQLCGGHSGVCGRCVGRIVSCFPFCVGCIILRLELCITGIIHGIIIDARCRLVDYLLGIIDCLCCIIVFFENRLKCFNHSSVISSPLIVWFCKCSLKISAASRVVSIYFIDHCLVGIDNFLLFRDDFLQAFLFRGSGVCLCLVGLILCISGVNLGSKVVYFISQPVGLVCSLCR